MGAVNSRWFLLILVLLILNLIVYYTKSRALNDTGHVERAGAASAAPAPAPTAPGLESLHLVGARSDDPRLIAYIRSKLNPPSAGPSNIRNRNPRIRLINKKYINNMKDGFFVEVGANDGEAMSNTLRHELYYNWTGLLIEGNSDLYATLLTKKRRAYSIHACISPAKIAFTIPFRKSGAQGHIMWKGEGSTIDCLPLHSLMLALNRTRIDLFTLDIQGDELAVLDTIPYDKLQIAMILVEFTEMKNGKAIFTEYLKGKGYTYLEEWGYDLLFVNQKLLKIPKEDLPHQ